MGASGPGRGYSTHRLARFPAPALRRLIRGRAAATRARRSASALVAEGELAERGGSHPADLVWASEPCQPLPFSIGTLRFCLPYRLPTSLAAGRRTAVAPRCGALWLPARARRAS